MDYEQFKAQVYVLTKIDLNSYKEKQMKRRIDSLIAKNNYSEYSEFIQAIKTNAELFEEFVNYLTINVSEFWRNPDQWKILEEDVIPVLLKNKGKTLKVWSAACSTGDEPYSLVMLLSRYMPLSDIKILATDIDKQVLERAVSGLYNEKSLTGLPKDLKEKFFTKVGLSNYQISEDIKKCVIFKQHNLLKDAYPEQLDLIVCRNVLIYFTDDAKLEIYKKFNKSLKTGGYLFVGSTEQIINYKDINYSSFKSFFYIKN
ncbi:MAG: protein-glutamate O-methyltransferase CheR [Clostridiales bacterium]|nr:protein-glutamate O-methyltransferase CheR [Clostridiales bacterium]